MTVRVDDEDTAAPSKKFFSRAKSSIELFEEAKENPDRFIDPQEVLHLVELEFPDVESRPTSEDMEKSVMEVGQETSFKMGHWIERIGNDMFWYLEPIRRVISKQVDTGDGKKETKWYYKTNSGLLYEASTVRAPREGLVRIFGAGPLLWQQWALMQTEKYIRFQDGHERDFQSVNFVRSASMLYDQWLNDPRNFKFKALYDSRPVCAQEKLKTHLFQPFGLMNDIAAEDNGWDFEDADCSIYQYNSMLGSGYLTSGVVFFIQLSSPFLILTYAVRSSNRFPLFLDNANQLNFESGNVGGWNDGNIPGAPGASWVPWSNSSVFLYSDDFAAIYWTDWTVFCQSYVAVDQFLMNIIVFLVYTTRVVPFIIDAFLAAVGAKDSCAARMNAIRYLSWLQGDDNIFLQMGFKLERYINTLYVALVNILMLFVLFLTSNTVSIILNALAIEFVYNFDKEIARSVWYDPDRRFISAGVIEMVLRSELLLEPLDFSDLLCETYDIDKEDYKREVGGEIQDAALAIMDDANPIYLSPKDRFWDACGKVAVEEKNDEAMWQFTESAAYFGVFDAYFEPRHGGVFKRYDHYFTWSRWEKVLFMCGVPEIGKSSTFIGIASNRNSKELFMNENPTSQRAAWIRFLIAILEVLMCKSMVQSVTTVYRREKYHHIPFRFLDGVFEWFAFFFVTLIFPGCLLFYLYLIFGCEPLV